MIYVIKDKKRENKPEYQTFLKNKIEYNSSIEMSQFFLTLICNWLL